MKTKVAQRKMAMISVVLTERPWGIKRDELEIGDGVGGILRFEDGVVMRT